MSLLNVDYKIILKVFAFKLKKYFQILSYLKKKPMLRKALFTNRED